MRESRTETYTSVYPKSTTSGECSTKRESDANANHFQHRLIKLACILGVKKVEIMIAMWVHTPKLVKMAKELSE